jgi:hypothetical protein
VETGTTPTTGSPKSISMRRTTSNTSKCNGFVGGTAGFGKISVFTTDATSVSRPTMGLDRTAGIVGATVAFRAGAAAGVAAVRTTEGAGPGKVEFGRVEFGGAPTGAAVESSVLLRCLAGPLRDVADGSGLDPVVGDDGDDVALDSAAAGALVLPRMPTGLIRGERVRDEDWEGPEACGVSDETFGVPLDGVLGFGLALASVLVLDDGGPAELSEPVVSAWAKPDPLVRAAPTPRVIAPAPNQLTATRRPATARCRPLTRRDLPPFARCSPATPAPVDLMLPYIYQRSSKTPTRLRRPGLFSARRTLPDPAATGIKDPVLNDE